jgi:peptidyl-prolyl cis-trans isomerase SurA
MKRFLFLLGGAALCSALCAQAELINGVSVVVNDSIITFDQIESGIAPIVIDMAKQYGQNTANFEKEVQKIRDRQVEELVERKLIIAEFKTAGYNLPETFIDDAIRDEIRNKYYGDRARLTKTLQAQGITFEMFRIQQRDRIILSYMNRHNVSSEKILISPAKIETYFKDHQDDFKVGDQVKLRMIVIPQNIDSTPGAAKKVATEILEKIDGGVPFAEMAGVYSSGSQRVEGGDRGWVDRSYLKPDLANVAFGLKPGQHSGVIELPEAVYVLLVEDARSARVRKLDEVRYDIEATLKNQEGSRLRKKWLDRLKNKSFVQYY